MIDKKLTQEEQEQILQKLFGFSFDEDVLIDDDGEEFYRSNINSSFDLSTLQGIFQYHASVHHSRGKNELRREINKLLNPFN